MSQKKPGLGKQLAMLHRWNGWIVLALTVSGLLLAWDVVRGWLNGEARNPIKQLHIALGLVSALILALYFPLMQRHLKQIRRRPRQKGNLGFVMVLLVGWIISGVVLWQIRKFPPQWANGALLAHDLLTWVGVPYILYHSVTRIRWMRKPNRRSVTAAEPEVAGAVGEEPAVAAAHTGIPPYVPQPWINRKQFLKWTLGGALAIAVAPALLKSLISATGGLGNGPSSGGMKDAADNANQMLPNPVPLPDSVNLVGGGAKGYFRVYSVTPLPTFQSETWRFKIDGLVDQPGQWNWEQFLGIARTVQVSDFHCVTGWSVYKNTWEGIPLSALLRAVGVKPEAKFVKLYSGDRVYTDSLTLEQANMDDVLVALLHDGKPIHRDYGGPVRLIVPKMYAYKSVKWLERIELIDKDHVGYWEQRGYDTDAWVRA